MPNHNRPVHQAFQRRGEAFPDCRINGERFLKIGERCLISRFRNIRFSKHAVECLVILPLRHIRKRLSRPRRKRAISSFAFASAISVSASAIRTAKEFGCRRNTIRSVFSASLCSPASTKTSAFLKAPLMRYRSTEYAPPATTKIAAIIILRRNFAHTRRYNRRCGCLMCHIW